ncbi:hypothetical protein CXK94_20115 [Stutzerimonas stutzeri]|uniref:Lnb N-terminal periplasmic domain-containing protein n=1 Tax=Stutzerimonas stutzeri TaxID=316 RepID=A0A2N8ST38_STUST|nr:DUF4105 domain-containing protein [Stutzerimonas stutzeri]MCQ4326129.1 DUF4105 domain-containing protein [Stutzerimonas stutzeri]PNG05666.1 hypothetical protein CXK94_20115 [Stutzerimonas stutzeri]
MKRPHPILRLSARLLLTPVLLLTTAWGALALLFRLDWPAPAGHALLVFWCTLGGGLLVLLWRRSPLWALAAHLLAFATLLSWWYSLQPSHQRIWADDVARMSHGRVVDDRLLLDNVRNFHWRSDQDYDITWESRSYDLRQLASVDLLTSYWGMPAIAHILVSFGFEDGRQLVFTVETRKEKGEFYSELGGFFKEFELSIVATDERDAVRVRTNVRDEDVYLYRIDMPRPVMRELLLSYVDQANALVERPRFYNTLTANCTTIVFDMVQSIIGGLPVDHRLLLTGYLPSYVRDIGGLQKGFSLDELRRRGRITERARQADEAPDFSRRIRQGVPGWMAETTKINSDD